MSMMEVEHCELCEANGHNVEKIPYSTTGTDESGNSYTALYCPCCDRWDRTYKAFAEQHQEDTIRQKTKGEES